MTVYRRQGSFIVGGFTTLAIVSSLRPIIIASAVDALEQQLDWMTLLLIALVVSAVIEYLANWTRRRFLSHVIGRLVSQMRKDAFSAAVDRDLAFYDRNKTGKIVSRITSDTQEFGDVLLFSSDVVAQLISILLLLAVLFSRSPVLTVI